MIILLDSSGWIELLVGSSRAALFHPALHAQHLIVPAIVRYEVARYTLSHGGESACELATSTLAKFTQVAIDSSVADMAAELAHKYKLAMADALIYAVTKVWNGELWTQDRHFESLPDVRFFSKKN